MTYRIQYKYKRTFIGNIPQDADLSESLNKIVIEEDIRAEIKRLKDAGVSYQEISRTLNAQEIETSNGGKQWYASTVRHAYLSYLKSFPNSE